MVGNINIGDRSIQFIVWSPFDPEEREHIGFGYGRWPTGETLAECQKSGWKDFGFHGFVVGLFELRYWPQRSKPTRSKHHSTTAT